MPLVSEVIDITGYPLIPLKKTADGQYVFPRNRFGILPYYITPSGQIKWGCIESNRVEPITFAPAAGTQDIIVIKDKQRLVLELGKPLPALGDEFTFLHSFTGQSFRETAFQEILTCLTTNGFQVYLENPLATAIHEAHEEHGIDLRKSDGHDSHLLQVPLESSPYHLIASQSGEASLGIWLPRLTSIDTVALLHTQKTESKMRRNLGRKFYEKGVWITLEEFENRFNQEKAKFASLDGCPPVKIELINETFRACERHIQFLKKIEPLLRQEEEQQKITEIIGIVRKDLAREFPGHTALSAAYQEKYLHLFARRLSAAHPDNAEYLRLRSLVAIDWAMPRSPGFEQRLAFRLAYDLKHPEPLPPAFLFRIFEHLCNSRFVRDPGNIELLRFGNNSFSALSMTALIVAGIAAASVGLSPPVIIALSVSATCLVLGLGLAFAARWLYNEFNLSQHYRNDIFNPYPHCENWSGVKHDRHLRPYDRLGLFKSATEGPSDAIYTSQQPAALVAL
jgi:hypothetical protein